MRFSLFAIISLLFCIVTSLPQVLQDDPNWDLLSSTSGISGSDLRKFDQGLTPIGLPSPSKPPVSSGQSGKSVDLVALGNYPSFSDSTSRSPYTNYDSSVSVLASTSDPAQPDPNVPIVLPGPAVLPPGIGTCKDNPKNKETDENGKILKGVYCCIHHKGVLWSMCKKFSNEFYCDPNSEDTVFACCEGIEDKSTIGPGIKCEDAPGESVRRKTYNSGNVRPPLQIPPAVKAVDDTLFDIIRYPNPAVHLLEGTVSGKKTDP